MTGAQKFIDSKNLSFHDHMFLPELLPQCSTHLATEVIWLLKSCFSHDNKPKNRLAGYFLTSAAGVKSLLYLDGTYNIHI